MIFILLSFSINIIAQKNAYLAGKIDYEKGLYKSAIVHLDKYFTGQDYKDEAFVIRGKAKLNLHQYSSAIEDFSKVNHKKFPELNLFLARAYAAVNNEKEAINYLKNYLKLKIKLPEEKIIAYPEFGNIADSREWEQLWTTKWYSKKENLLQNAEEELNTGNYQSAESFLNEYIIKYKENSHVFFLKAQLSVLRNNDKDAIDYLEKAIEIENNINFLIIKGQTEFRLKKYKNSLKTLNEAFQKDSLNLDIVYERSFTYSALKKHELAKADIKKYLYYYPAKVEGLERLALINKASGDFLAAIQTYGKLIEKYPAKTEYYKERANAYMETHTYKYAIKDYSMALDLYPRDAEIYFQKGNAHYKLREVQKACYEWKWAQKYGSLESSKLIYKYCR
ncbi:MAG: tetratricopeptide repeat protein [Bacteroidota bacterium]